MNDRPASGTGGGQCGARRLAKQQQQGADTVFQAGLLLAAVRACKGEVVIGGEEDGPPDDTF